MIDLGYLDDILKLEEKEKRAEAEDPVVFALYNCKKEEPEIKQENNKDKKPEKKQEKKQDLIQNLKDNLGNELFEELNAMANSSHVENESVVDTAEASSSDVVYAEFVDEQEKDKESGSSLILVVKNKAGKTKIDKCWNSKQYFSAVAVLFVAFVSSVLLYRANVPGESSARVSPAFLSSVDTGKSEKVDTVVDKNVESVLEISESDMKEEIIDAENVDFLNLVAEDETKLELEETAEIGEDVEEGEADDLVDINLEEIEAEISNKVSDSMNGAVVGLDGEVTELEDIIENYILAVRDGDKVVSNNEIRAIAEAIVKFSNKYKLPVDLVVAVTQTESNFRPSAVSSADARGLMQVMWKYHGARLQALKIAKKKEDLHKIDAGVEAGCLVLSSYIKEEKSATRALGRYYGALQRQYVATTKAYMDAFALFRSGMFEGDEWKKSVNASRNAWEKLFSGNTRNSSSSSSSRKMSAKTPAKKPEQTPAKEATTARKPAASSTTVYNSIKIQDSSGKITKVWDDKKK